MSVIEMTRHHTLDAAHAKSAAEDLAKDLARDFDVHWHWQEDALLFKRTGVTGSLLVSPDLFHIRLELGFLLRPLKGRIEREVHRHLDDMVRLDASGRV